MLKGALPREGPLSSYYVLAQQDWTGYKTLDGIDVAPVQPGTIKDSNLLTSTTVSLVPKCMVWSVSSINTWQRTSR